MDTFVSHKRRKIETVGEQRTGTTCDPACEQTEEQSTDEKLAILSSIFEDNPHEDLLEALLNNDGFVEAAINSMLTIPNALSTYSPSPRKGSGARGIQSSLKFNNSIPGTIDGASNISKAQPRVQTTRGKTLYLYDPASIAANTPCSIIYNFLPKYLADALLQELLPETQTFTSATFRLFDNVVKSPHTASFYVSSSSEAEKQKSEYLYNGSTLGDVREILPTMRQVSSLVESAVNDEITKRIQDHYPHGKKLKHQAPGPWRPNAAFVNCYDGAQQSVGYHTDQLSYLGPHPIIGSLSLGVQREFRIRRIVPPPDLERLHPEADADEIRRLKNEHANAQGQISLPLPHNSLLVMHAEMQETWKHSIAPAATSSGGNGKNGGITPHPIAGNKRINITYRWYREEFSPNYTLKCRCGVPCVLKSVMRRRETLGRYVWMCQTPGRVDGTGDGEREKEKDKSASGIDVTKGCGYFVWAEFDDDGVPIWKKEKEAR